jgi:hypothetical protein
VREELEAKVRQAREETQEAKAALERQRQEREQEEREPARATIASQTLGAGLFLLGAVLSVLGNAINC